MKYLNNIYLFYILAMLPLGAIIVAALLDFLDGYLLFLCMLSFLIYRIFLDGFRLVALGKIKYADIWKLVLPGFYMDYWKDIYTDKSSN